MESGLSGGGWRCQHARMPDKNPATPTARKSGFSKGLIGILVILISSALSVFFRYDASLDPAADLQPRRPLLTDHSFNGFAWLTDKWASYPKIALYRMHEAEEMQSGDKPWDQAAADALDPVGASYAEDLEHALAMRDWQMLTGLHEGETDSRAAQCFFQNGRLANFRVISHFRQKRSEEAYRLWDSILTAAQRSFQNTTCLFDASAALALLGMSSEPALDAAGLPADQVDDAMLERIQNRLLSVRITAEDLSETLRRELFWSFGLMRAFKEAGPDPDAKEVFPDKAAHQKFARHFFKPNRTMNLKLEAQRRAEPLLMRPASTFLEAWPSRIPGDLISEPGPLEWLNSNRTGMGMMRESKEDFWAADKSGRSILARLRSTAVGVALRRWQRGHGGGLPEELTELVPGILNAVPEDPFDGKPLRWDRVKGVVYSIGSDWREEVPDFKSSDEKRPVGRFDYQPDSPGVRVDVPPAP